MALAGISGAGGFGLQAGAGGMGLQPMPSAQNVPSTNFRPSDFPSAPEAVADGPSSGPGGGFDIKGVEDMNPHEADKVCLAVELDGAYLTASCWDGKSSRTIIKDDSTRISVPHASGGALVRWCDSKEPYQRATALPQGVLVGADASKGDSETSVVDGLDRLLGRGPGDPCAVQEAKRRGLTLKPRKVREARQRIGILGPESDDESDEVDGGLRCYNGSTLCLELPSTNRSGATHVLPEEALAMVLVDVRRRAAKNKKSPPPRSVTMVIPGTWGDAPRSAAQGAVARLGLKWSLISSPLATAAGSLLTKAHAQKIRDDLIANISDDSETVSCEVLVVVGSRVNLEASVVKITASKEALKEKDTDGLHWVQSMQTLVVRGDTAACGLDDIIDGLDKKDSISSDAVGKVVKEPLCRILNEVLSVKPPNEITRCVVRGHLSTNRHFGAILAADLKERGIGAKILEVENDVAVKGATAITCARRAMKGSVFSAKDFSAVDSLPCSYGLATTEKAPFPQSFAAGDSAVDLILSRDAPLPQTIRRTVKSTTSRFSSKKKSVAVVEEDPTSALMNRAMPLGNPLVRVNQETGLEEEASEVTLVVTATEDGLVSVSTDDFKSIDDDADASPVAKHFGRILLTLVLVLMAVYGVGTFGGSALKRYRVDQDKFQARRNALIDFYLDVNPEKVDTVEKTLYEFRGRESQLWNRLEKKYNKRPSRPNFRRSEL
mmetsp:Transcript_64839/g.89042  ORF Transcript_64839/g.89042 Transcript_64839/m.89042 type:complete len:721 (-) Transcript_64839:449-2611(-)